MKEITWEEYSNHDCHLSSEDGCEVCERWFRQEKEQEEQIKDGLEKEKQCNEK